MNALNALANGKKNWFFVTLVLVAVLVLAGIVWALSQAKSGSPLANIAQSLPLPAFLKSAAPSPTPASPAQQTTPTDANLAGAVDGRAYLQQFASSSATASPLPSPTNITLPGNAGGLPPTTPETQKIGKAVNVDNVPMRAKGSLTLWPTGRQVVKSGYLYLVDTATNNSYVLNPVQFYNGGKTTQLQDDLGKYVEVTGTIYQDFTDPQAPAVRQHAVLLETIKVVTP